MDNGIIFIGVDAKEKKVSIPALELKEYTNKEQVQEIADIKSKLETNAAVIKSNKIAIENNNTQLANITESLTNANNSISGEITARQNAVSELKIELSESIKTEIEKENTGRIKTENTIKSQIEQEAKDRLNADNELESKLYQEIATALTKVDFATADKKIKSDLTSYIETVQTDVTGKVNNLSTRINDLQQSLNEETANRIAGDNALQNNSNHSSSSSSYSSNYEIISIDHTEQGEVFDDSIFLQSFNSKDSHITAAQLKKYMAAASKAEFDIEVNTRKLEDSRLDAKILAETTSRKEQATELQNQIDSLGNRTTTNENTLSVLTGNGEGSIRKAIADKIAEVVSDAPEAFDTLKEIADWVAEHEQDALSLQRAISTNANTISKEIDERKNEISNTNLALENEKTERKKEDNKLQANLIKLNQALEAETAERENTKKYIHDTLKEEFEEKVADITNNKIAGIVDDKLSEARLAIGKNTQDISALESKVENNKEKIDELNETIFSEKTDQKLLVSTANGVPNWQPLTNLLKSMRIDSSNVLGGALRTNIPLTAKMVSFVPDSDSRGGDIMFPFKMPGGNWCIRCSTWWGNGSVKGTIYYID